MYKQYINRITGFLTIVMIILFSSNLSAQYISGPTSVTLGQYADYYFVGASSPQVASSSWSVDYGSVQGVSSGVNYVSASFSFIGTNYINVDYFNGFYWDQVYLQVEVVDSNVSTPILSSVTQPNCTTSTGSFVITNYNSSYNYTASPSNGVIISGSIVTAPLGSYTITATSGVYSSNPSASVTVNSQPTTPEAPTVGSITQPTDANPTGSVILSNLPSSGTWIINPGNVSGTGTTKTITGLAPDTIYNFTVTNALDCVSNASTSVGINIQPSGAVKPTLSSVTQPSCTTSTGSFTITNYNASYTYSASPSAGVFISGATVTAPTGSYTIMATSASGINSSPSGSITVNAQPAAPTTPIVGTIMHPTATSTGSVVLSNLPSNDSWIINPGNISGSGTTNVTITGLAPSVQPYSFTVTNSLGCISSPSANVVINGYCGISDENYVHTITPTIATNNVSTLNNSQKIEGITYYDGIGRPMQKIGIRAGEVINDITGTMVLNDIINPIEYDEFGRQRKEYLPYSDTFSCGSFRGTTLMNSVVTGFYNTNKYENTTNPYSEKEFEASPLNRVLKQAAPGNDWKLGNGHEIKLGYQTNTASEVKNFKVSLAFANNTYTPTLTQSIVNNGFYNANELYKTVTYDENSAATPTELNGSTVEFKNKQGQVVLKRTYGIVGTGTTNEKHDTYYVYDDLGNLSYVIPPKAVDLIGSGTSQQANLSSTAVVTSGTTLNLTASNTIILSNGFHAQAGSTFSAVITASGNQNSLDDLCYQYKYDNRNRLVEKKLPGKQWEYIVYDKLDRVVATGPVLSPFNDTSLGVVGWLITKYDVFSRPVYTGWEQSTTVISDGRITKQNDQNAATAFNESKQTAGTIDGITAYYSNDIAPTSFKLLTVNYYDSYTFPGAVSIPTTVETQDVLTTAAGVKGLATGSWTRIPSAISGTQAEIATTFYDKKARPVRTYSTNFLGGYTYRDSKLDFTGKPEFTITYHKRLSGDAELKTKEVFSYSPQGRLLTQTHQIGTGTVELIASNSYDELGQLIAKEVGGNTQKVNYTYNIRGWLKGINDISSLTQSGDPKDLFAFKINYNTIPSGIADVKALYNGNIAETQWATNSDNGVLRTYGYKYDNLNRLTAGLYKKVDNNNVTVFNAYNESMDYDKNGNIIHLTRYGSLDDNTQTLIDNLTYNYLNNNTTNQLVSVDDTVSNNSNFINEFKNTSGNDYMYDVNGNMLRDANKGITTDIVYNHLNLPTQITFGTTGNIIYIYNATGQKVQKVFTQGATITTTDYLGGYQYKNADLKFFPTTEGYVEPNGSSYKYVFQYKDHLGNVRLSYDKTLVVQEENDYYPFGLKHTGYGYSQVVNSDYKYKYNGKELQDELGLNMYDYGNRHYDPSLGRFVVIDNFSEDFSFQSPYVYAANNPVIFIDKDGDGPILGILGALAGAAIEGGSQVVGAMATGSSFSEAVNGIDYADVGIAAVEGGLAGLTNGASLLVTSKVSDGLQASIDINGKGEVSTIGGGFNGGKTKNGYDAAGDFIIGKSVGAMFKFGGNQTNKILDRTIKKESKDLLNKSKNLVKSNNAVKNNNSNTKAKSPNQSSKEVSVAKGKLLKTQSVKAKVNSKGAKTTATVTEKSTTNALNEKKDEIK